MTPVEELREALTRLADYYGSFGYDMVSAASVAGALRMLVVASQETEEK